MSEILSKEELEALLKKSVPEDDDDEGSAVQKSDSAEASQASSASFSSFDDPQGRSQMGRGAGTEKKRVQLKRSAKMDESTAVQKAVFQSLDYDEPPSETTNLEVILNLGLEIRVELGTTRQTVREILEMGSGSVMELDKQNGEPVDLMVNQRGFARGEMIVIGDNFGVRVTDILSVHEIIEALR